MSEMLTQASSVASLIVEEITEQVELGTMEAPAFPVNFEGDRNVEALRFAISWYGKQPEWAAFYREVLGVSGVVRRLFPTAEQYAAFEQTEQFSEIQQMLTKLREKPALAATPVDDREPTRVITVRLPKSLHESLREEAQDKRTSMNQLCISKLLLAIDAEEVPAAR